MKDEAFDDPVTLTAAPKQGAPSGRTAWEQVEDFTLPMLQQLLGEMSAEEGGAQTRGRG